MPNSEGKALALPRGQASQDDLNIIPKHAYEEFQATSLYCGFRLIQVYPNSQKREPGKTYTRIVGYSYSCCDEYVPIPGPKPLLSEFGFHHSLESCDH